jgi:hypothetical protein
MVCRLGKLYGPSNRGPVALAPTLSSLASCLPGTRFARLRVAALNMALLQPPA